MAEWALTAVDQTRYQSATGAALRAWLAHYLAATEFQELFAKVGNGVDVYFKDPGLKAVNELTKPRLILWYASEEAHPTIFEAPDPQEGDPGHTALFHGSFVTMTWEVEATTGPTTGAQLTCMDLLTTVRRICELHHSDLAAARLLLMPAVRQSEIVKDDELNLWHGTLTLEVEIALTGAKVE